MEATIAYHLQTATVLIMELLVENQAQHYRFDYAVSLSVPSSVCNLMVPPFAFKRKRR